VAVGHVRKRETGLPSKDSTGPRTFRACCKVQGAEGTLGPGFALDARLPQASWRNLR